MDIPSDVEDALIDTFSFFDLSCLEKVERDMAVGLASDYDIHGCLERRGHYCLYCATYRARIRAVHTILKGSISVAEHSDVQEE